MRRIIVGALVAFASLIVVGARSDDTPSQVVDHEMAQTYSAFLRIGMNLEVSELIRKGDTEGAVQLLNTMNILEVTPLLTSSDDDGLISMKRRVFRRRTIERSKFAQPSIRDQASDQLNKNIDEYLRKYR
ncbi:MAG TPA: hypothetical protein VFE23_05050 [Usitatibacter sp.]|jgi:hypothetical protein|nr:hypothetical protein [Usitatibacter sp.]